MMYPAGVAPYEMFLVHLSFKRFANACAARSIMSFMLACLSGAIPLNAFAETSTRLMKSYNVRDFGAGGDGKSADTSAINRAIDAAASAGGGTVQFPAGQYSSFSIHLKSNICLQFDEGATLVAATPGPAGDYDPPEFNPAERYQDRGHGHWHNSLICGDGVENISIGGKGRILGTGLVRGLKRPSDTGDKMIALVRCRNVKIRDLTLGHGGHFAILATGVDDMTVDHLTVDTNRDGIDIDSSQDIRITNCTVNAPHDDGICLKSSCALGELRPTENVVIRNCHITGFDEGTLLDGTRKREDAKTRTVGPVGRIKLGTESNGGFKNISITDCTLEYCRGLALETVDGGTLEDVSIKHITMQDIADSPIFLRLGERMRGPAGKLGTPVMRRIDISDVECNNSTSHFPVLISGITLHAIEDVKLSNIRIEYPGAGTKLEATTQPADSEGVYPDPAMFGQIPAYGLYVRHAKNVQIDGMRVTFAKDDWRPPFMFDDVADATLSRSTGQHLAEVPTVRIKHVTDFKIESCDAIADDTVPHADDRGF
jgi:polygalacturonase